MNAILCNDAHDWSGTEASVFGIIRNGALASGYGAADLPPLVEVFRTFAAGVAGGGSTGWGFVPLSVSEDPRPIGAIRPTKCCPDW
jgi:hypothetical protein